LALAKRLAAWPMRRVKNVLGMAITGLG
jgi:hypothetical protein